MKFVQKKKKKGFTLIELIVVIAILGILAAIALPRFANFQGDANKRAIATNLTVIDNAIDTYIAQKNVARAGVKTTDIAGAGLILNAMPVGPSGVVYSINAAGFAEATLAANIPGVNAGTYVLDPAKPGELK